MTQLKALIFDVDGTLADTEKDGHRVVFNQAFAEAGLKFINFSDLNIFQVFSVLTHNIMCDRPRKDRTVF
jgi:phosphoglycolate phosphatase-like HAD superfamily hydrolase